MGVVLAMKDDFEERQPDLRKANEAAKQSVGKRARESINLIEERNRRYNAKHHGCDCPLARCDDTCTRYLTHYASRAEFWAWWGKSSPPDRKAREAILQIPAPAAKGSGSKSKRKKKAKKISELRKYVLE